MPSVVAFISIAPPNHVPADRRKPSRSPLSFRAADSIQFSDGYRAEFVGLVGRALMG